MPAVVAIAAQLQRTADCDGNAAVIHCRFCEIAVRIPSHALRSLGSDDPRELRWWLYFSGVSAAREKLARNVVTQADEEQKRREEAARREATARAERAAKGRAAAEAAEAAEQKRKRDNRFVALALGAFFTIGPAFGAGVYLYGRYKRSHPKQTASAPPTTTRTDDLLKRFDFTKPVSNAEQLFGVKSSDGKSLDVDFNPAGVIAHAHISYGNQSGVWAFTLTGSHWLNEAWHNVARLAPHHAYGWSSQNYSLNGASLGVGHTPENEKITMNHATNVLQAKALWDAALYMAYSDSGQPKPPPAELALLNGPKLTELASLDLRLSADKASAKDAFSKYPASSCSRSKSGAAA